jgi:hypothetical protein
VRMKKLVPVLLVALFVVSMLAESPPIVHAAGPTLFGNDGALTNAVAMSSTCFLGEFETPATNGGVSEIFVGLKASAASSYAINVGVYSSAGTRLTQASMSVSITTSAAYYGLALPLEQTLTASTNYYLAVTSTDTTHLDFYNSATTGGTSETQASCTALPSSTGTVTANTDVYDIYAYYQVQNTLQNSEPDGLSGSSVPWHYESNGIYTSVAVTTAGTSVWSDMGAVLYPEAYNSHAAVDTSTEQFSAVPLTYGLVGYWPMDEATSGTCSGASIFDLSHNNDTGVCSNSPTWTTGKFGGGLSFTANSTQEVTIPISKTSPLNVSATVGNSWFFTIWFRPTGPQSPSSGPDEFFAGDSGSDTRGYCGRFFYNHGGTIGFRLYDLTLNPSAYTAVLTASNYNKWQFLVGGYNYQTKQIFIYLNATTPNTTSYTVTESLCGTSMLLNGQAHSKNPYSLDDFRVYSGVPTAALVSELYASTIPNLEQSPSSGGNTYTTDYYQQYPQTVSYSAVSGSPSGNALQYQYTNIGTAMTVSAGTSFTLTTSGQSIWADNTQPYTVGDYYAAATERYSQNQNGTVSGANTVAFSVYHQWYDPVVYSVTGCRATCNQAATLTYPFYGVSSTLAVTQTLQHQWIDAGTASVGNLLDSLGNIYTTSPDSWTISSATSISDPIAYTFYEQAFCTSATKVSAVNSQGWTLIGLIPIIAVAGLIAVAVGRWQMGKNSDWKVSDIDFLSPNVITVIAIIIVIVLAAMVGFAATTRLAAAAGCVLP